MRQTLRGRYHLQLVACLALAGGWALVGQARADEGKAEGDKPLATAKHDTA
jgi:hypothetical protein